MPKLAAALGPRAAHHRVRPLTELRAVARAIDALRRGWPVAIGTGDARLALLAVETADPQRLAEFDPGADSDLLISHERAATLGLVRTSNDLSPVRIAGAHLATFETAVGIADPAYDHALPADSPRTGEAVATAEAIAAIRLARLAGLLPAYFTWNMAKAEVELAPEQVAAYEAPGHLTIAARASLPLAMADTAEIVAFRSGDDASEHVALLIGMPNGRPPLVRLHSECLTGDVLGSLKCDCGPQLHAALRELTNAGWGVVLYLRQEGRGIGLVNKLRAYALQDQGFDTVDANMRLGFAHDTRDFGMAARMLDLLGIRQVRLLTNNPAKVAGLAVAGIHVIERVAHTLPANPHNADYLDAKRRRAGHLL